MHNTVEFSSSQSKAISHGTGPMLVIAGPGSGKTLVITHRIKNLIVEHKVRPENILVITFTKAAAIEMQYRFHALTDDLNISLPVNFGTCHAIFFQIIREATLFNANCIIKENEKREILEEILNDSNKKEGFILEPAIETIQKLLSEISRVKNQSIELVNYECPFCSDEEFRFIYNSYIKECLVRQKLDFDDMLLKCLELLKSNQALLKKYQNAFSYILVDEFQDINPVQYEIIRLLSQNDNNIFVVGDDDQSIYGFRGATPNIMNRFVEDYKDTIKVELCENYRSSKQIVEVADRLISKNENRFIKHPVSKKSEKGYVKYIACENRQEQYDEVIRCISEYMKSENNKFEDIAILYRTNGHISMLLSELTKYNIPFNCRESVVNVYDTEIAKDLMAYIRFSLNQQDVNSFYRIMNRPVRYIKRKLVPMRPFTKEEIIALQENENVIQNLIHFYNQIDFIKRMEPYPAINFIRKGMGYDMYLKEQKKDMEVIDEITEDAKKFTTLKEWLYFAEHFEETVKKGMNKKSGVNISTMHGSKGLEYKVVILPDLNEGMVPHKKARTKDEIEEERRIFYVALTRAKNYLFFFFVKSKKAEQITQPSRFISDCI